ncbi:MAG TPA: 4'-phosphopantetheinyl transferase superfamily protein [Acidimicrobiales bacterium]
MKAVDVWWLNLAATQAQVAAWKRLLSPDESERAERYRFRHDHDRFVAGRARVRLVLGDLLGQAPSAVTFAYGPWGKPHLDGAELEFNLSHSGEIALLAVADGVRVGVDVEGVRHELVGDRVAERFFAPGEVRRLDALAERERMPAFFECWTRKEAFVKANGAGLSCGLDDFEVSFGPTETPAVVSCVAALGTPCQWSVLDVSREPGMPAAVVVESADVRLVAHREETATQPILTRSRRTRTT